MSQSTRTWISQKIQALAESNVLLFQDILDADMVGAALAEEGVTFNACIYTPLVTLSVFLSQVLDPDHSCRAAVARLIVWLAVNRRKTCAAETNTYCEARQRLPLGVVVRLAHQTAREIDGLASRAWLWKGRRVTLVDGTTASMPDSAESQRRGDEAFTVGHGPSLLERRDSRLARRRPARWLSTRSLREFSGWPGEAHGLALYTLFRRARGPQNSGQTIHDIQVV